MAQCSATRDVQMRQLRDASSTIKGRRREESESHSLRVCVRNSMPVIVHNM